MELIKGESCTIGFIFNAEYNTANIRSFTVNIGREVFTPALVSGVYRLEISSERSKRMAGDLPVIVNLDDVNFGVRKEEVRRLTIVSSYSNFANSSNDLGLTYTVRLTVDGSYITSDVVLLQGIKGDKGDQGEKGEKGDPGSGGGGGGHTILNEAGDSMTQRAKLQFIGATVTDDAGNDTTEVEIHTHSNKSVLDQISAAFTTALKSAYDGAVTWISTNGSNLLNHLTNTSNPHSVTKLQVGLGNVDNTSDTNKPISSATQTALNGKANQSTEEVLDPSTGSSAIADVHLAANANNANYASNAGNANNASNDSNGYQLAGIDPNTNTIHATTDSATSATNDSDGNQINTTYQKLPNQYSDKGSVADSDKISLSDIDDITWFTSFSNIWTWIKTKLGIDTVTGSATKFLNQVGNWVDIVVSSGGGSVDIFASNVDSDISGYKSASLIADAATTTKTINSGAANTVVWGEKYLYGSAIGVTTIPSGFWELHLFGQVSTAVDVSQAVLGVFKYSGGTETQLFTADSVEINNTAAAEIIIKTNQPQYTVLATDRIGVQVGFKSSSANPSKTFTYTIGNGSASHFNTPLAARHSGLRLLNEQVEYQHINLSNTPITGQFPASLTIPEGVPQIYSTAQLTNTVTVSLGSVVAGKIGIYTLKFETGATKPTITWPTSGVKWVYGIEPTVNNLGVNKKYVVQFIYNSATDIEARYDER